MPIRLSVDAWPDFEPWNQDGVYADWRDVVVSPKAKCGRITVRVVAAETRELLNGVSLTFVGSGEDKTSAGSVRLKDGRFDTLVPPGEVRLEAMLPGRESVSTCIRVGALEWFQDIELAMPLLPEVSLVGHVLDMGGLPVPGAKVSLFTLIRIRTSNGSVENPHDIAALNADHRGNFHFSGLTPGDLLLSISADGYEPTGSIALNVPGDGAEVHVHLAPSGRLRLRSIAPDGKILAPTRVILQQNERPLLQVDSDSSVARQTRNFRIYGANSALGEIPPHHPPEEARWDRDGYLVIDGVPPGEYDLVLDAPQLSATTRVIVKTRETTVASVLCR